MLSTGCVFGFDTTVPESGGVDEGDGAGVDAADGRDPEDAPDVYADGDATDAGDGAQDADASDLPDADADGVDADAGPDADVVTRPDADADTGAEDDADTNPAEDANADGDATPPLRCTDLDCDSEGRLCDEGDDTTDARCGQCLSGFIEDGDACVATSCRGAGDCAPNPAASEWSTCGGYADACAREGTQTRLVYTGDCEGGRCEVTSVEQDRECPELRVTDGDPCVVAGAVGECRSGTCAVVPGQVTGVSASDGTSPSFVRVTWSAVEGATGYNVYRDGLLLTTSPVTALAFEDSTAGAGAVPERVTGVNGVAGTDRITIIWTAASSAGSAGRECRSNFGGRRRQSSGSCVERVRGALQRQRELAVGGVVDQLRRQFRASGHHRGQQCECERWRIDSASHVVGDRQYEPWRQSQLRGARDERGRRWRGVVNRDSPTYCEYASRAVAAFERHSRERVHRHH
jgi:hypothetical protein